MRFHFGERDRDGDRPLDVAVMDACARHGVWAAALLRGVEGFGGKQHVRTERILSLSEDQPLVAVAVGEGERVEALAEELAGLATTGTPTTTSAGVGVPVVGSPADVVRATIWGPRSGQSSPHLRAVDAMYRHGAESATVLLGVDGVLDGERRRARFVAANRGVPAMTVAVGERTAITAAVAELGTVANLVTFEGVERNRPYAAERFHGARVALVTSEIARCGAHPLYLEFIHELRRGGAAGATALRGVWGFRGDVAPHGDRALALRRDVPLIVETVDTAERSAKWLEIAESLAGEDDLVYRMTVGSTLILD
jgi:PII-like signaling protein